MNRPLSSTRILLVADRRSAASDPRALSIRRYRLARLHLDRGRPPLPAGAPSLSQRAAA